MAAAKIKFGTYAATPPVFKPIEAKAIVQFRTHSAYHGEFGFDWMRMGDTGKLGDTWYAKIIGEYEGLWDFNKEEYEGGLFEIKDWAYQKLMHEFKVMAITWKKDFYIIPIATIYPKRSAEFTLKVEIEEEPEEISYQFDTTFFSLNKTTIPSLAKGKHQLTNELKITCLKEFAVTQNIDVIAKSSNGKKHLVGRLKIKANDKASRRQANIVFVNVITNINNSTDPIKGILDADKIKQKEYLTKFLQQALVTPHIVNEKLDLWETKKTSTQTLNKNYTIATNQGKIFNKYHNTSGENLTQFLAKEFNSIPTNAPYKEHYKVFFMGEYGARKKSNGGLQPLGGHANGIPSKECVMYFNPKEFVVTHELLHCMGVFHSFNNNSNYTFLRGKTDNIMDYSHLSTPKIPQLSTWQWQWKILTDANENEP
ncbi:hypothetical protein [Tenacibaculum maritimum]|uniref:hypothetical protein n=2 Tax=Tenacibaculum maritimum TaxID=107401 RepID=UPI0012E5945F|nr:hypothetical protein [Tenacibaculum maritimum]CAA0172506.1 hypothetical protein DPIF89300162_170012 [Tenacibaculum maritimum]